METETPKRMEETEVTQYILDTFENLATSEAMGYRFFFYGEDRMQPFATIAMEDSEYEQVSDLNRPGVFRLNVGVNPETYRAMFGKQPPPPGESGIINTGHDFTALDVLMPHPVYAPQSWVCVLNPSAATFEEVKQLIAEAYERARRREEKRA